MNVCVLVPLLVIFAAINSADGTASSGTFTLKVPSATAGAKLPELSLICPARSETVYVPLSARSHVPPGAAMRYVAVLGVPSLLTSTLRNVAVWL